MADEGHASAKISEEALGIARCALLHSMRLLGIMMLIASSCFLFHNTRMTSASRLQEAQQG